MAGEKVLDLIELRSGELIKETQTESLCNWRSCTVEHRVDAGDFKPLGSDLGLYLAPGIDISRVCHALGPLEATSQFEVDSWISGGLGA